MLPDNDARLFPSAHRKVGELFSPFLDKERLFDALHALSLLDGRRADVTLSELALAFRRGRLEAAARPRIPLGDFFVRYESHFAPEQTASRANARWIGSVLSKALGRDTPVACLRREDVLGALKPYDSPTTYNSLVERLGAAVRWGRKEGLCDLPWIDGVERKPTTFHEPVFFRPDRVERIFRAAEAHPGPPRASVGAFLTLGFFAGVRTAEILRAEWADLNLDEGVLRIPRPKGWTNGRRPRLVELEENAVAWMRYWRRWTTGQRRGHEPRGAIVPDGWRLTEWKREQLEPSGDSWGNDEAHNVMRHTYATMHVGAFREAAATALNLGHGRGLEILEKHYRGLVSRTVAQAYWNIYPSSGAAS